MDEQLEQYVVQQILDSLEIVYDIPRNISMQYLRDNTEFLYNTIDRMDEALDREIEEWVPSTDIISHQEKDK